AARAGPPVPEPSHRRTPVRGIPAMVHVQVTVAWNSLVPSAWSTCRSSSVNVPVSAPESAPVAFAVMIVLESAVRAPVGVMLVNTKLPLPVDGAVAAAGCANSATATMAARPAFARGRPNVDPLIAIPPLDRMDRGTVD